MIGNIDVSYERPFRRSDVLASLAFAELALADYLECQDSRCIIWELCTSTSFPSQATYREHCTP
jgi:hypothetical protein